MKKVFDHGIYNKDVTSEESFGFFKDLMIQHSIENREMEPQEDKDNEILTVNHIDSVRLFELPQLNSITEFVSTCFYRNFRAYQMCFNEVQESYVDTRSLVVETPLTPPPLELATEQGEEAQS
eukprot:CAMPEP_0117756488 /NCGR_PEP_ID=MMETSP0947-20121206/14113_1 /TAXON_ID=44440 /ORGANISM="Chattonella subsalsa, Strain CCMP2191" /LENGTH=122 /DNA_ID=CAMNT_0005576095 /DNA_START=444 /DNA_END=812 /DNA_ORIENTATION=-